MESKEGTEREEQKGKGKEKQALNEEMVRKGRETTRKQYTLRSWAIEGGPLGKEGKGREKEEDGDKENKSDTRNKKQAREGEREVRKGIG